MRKASCRITRSRRSGNLTAYTYYLQEDYQRAIGAYINVIKQPELPDALMQSTLKTLSQLYFTIEDYKRPSA